MTANGSAGDTLAEFQTLFGMDLDTLNAYCTKALQEYSNLGGSTKSTFVNSLWYNPALTLKDDFVAQCQQNYGAELYQADLQNAATVQAVNDWVSQATNGLIPKTVDNFSKLSIMALVNAIYLQNKFEAPLKRLTLTGRWTLLLLMAQFPIQRECTMACVKNGTFPIPMVLAYFCLMMMGA